MFGCDAFVTHFEMIAGSLPNCSTNHLSFVYFSVHNFNSIYVLCFHDYPNKGYAKLQLILNI